jgi:DNA modification methylase
MIKQENSYALNAICPYFTMFPLDFPLSILRKYASKEQWVLDPFCGRGTTNYASRALSMSSVGIDASPVAVALSEAKLLKLLKGFWMRMSCHKRSP